MTTAFVRGASLALIASLLLAGCASGGGGTLQSQDPDGGGISLGSLFGRGDRGPAQPAATAAQGIGVNGYLWRASLDILEFMPLVSADPFGGVIITDWYSSAQTPTERFKATVYILDTRLRADALNVAIVKQQQNPAGAWVDVQASPQTETDIENSILTRARQLRLSNVGG